MRIVQTADIHPLDRKKPEKWLDMEIDEGNYHHKVRSAFTHILESTRGISEKDFKGVDAVMAEADKRCRNKANTNLIDQAERDGMRPEFCAEKIFYQMSKSS